jgi:hypothetical protein
MFSKKEGLIGGIEMYSLETSDKIILKDKDGNTYEISKFQGSCELKEIEILTQRGKESLKGGEGGLPFLAKGKYEKRTGIIKSVKAAYACPRSKEKTFQID